MKKVVAVILLLIFAVSIFNFSAFAQEENENEETEEVEQEQKRAVEVKIEGDKVEIESKAERAGVENKFEIEFETEEEVEIKLKYEEESEVNLTEFETELEQEVEFESLIEFVDANGNGVFDKGEEVFELDLENANFVSPTYVTRLTANNVTEHVISTQTTDGVLKITLHAVGEFASVAGETVRPTEVKIDVAITNFPFKNDTSKLALQTKVESTMEVETEKHAEAEEEEVTVRTTEGFEGFFSWTKTVLVDGVEKTVLSTSLRDDPEEGKEEFFLIYERGSSILHDPKIGFVVSVVALPIALPVAPLTLVYVVVGIIVVLALALLLLRRR